MWCNRVIHMEMLIVVFWLRVKNSPGSEKYGSLSVKS